MINENIEKRFYNKLIESTSAFITIPVLVFYVGFIYASGFFSPLTKFNIFNLSFIGTYPFSNYFVYICGGFQTLKLVIVCIFAWISWIVFEQIVQLFVKTPIVVNGYRRWRFIVVIVTTIILGVPFLFLLLISNTITGAKSINIFLLYGIEIGMFFSYILCIKCIEYFKQVCILNNWSDDLDTVLSRRMLFYLTTLVTASGAIYFNGFQEQVNLIQSYNIGQGDYIVADVFSGKEKPCRYIEIETTNDLFVGYDKESKVITVIPMDKVDKIERSIINKNTSKSQTQL